MGAKDRLKAYCKASGIRISDFEKKIGASNGYVNSISKWVGPEYERAILENFPNLNIIWAEKGIGEMFVGEPSQVDEKAGAANLIPLLPFSAVAGFMAGGNELDAYRGEESVAFPDFTERGADCVIRVDGDSMYPRYCSGDILAVRIIQDPTFFQWGKVYVLNTNQGCVVKILLPDPSDPERIICRSVNTERYPDYKISKSDIYGVAIVVGHAGVE